MTEEWRPVVGFEGLYEVSDLGRVRSLPRTILRTNHLGRRHPKFVKGRVIRSTIGRDGYERVSLYSGGKRTAACVHSIVAAAFLGLRPEGAEVCHYDGVRHRNAVSNIRYGSRRENHADKARHGTARDGAKSHFAKLTLVQVRRIRQMLAEMQTHEQIAHQFGVARETVTKIANGRTWARHV